MSLNHRNPMPYSMDIYFFISFTAAVVITFFVCWAPFHAQRLLYLYGQKMESFKALNQWVFAVSGWLYYVSW